MSMMKPRHLVCPLAMTIVFGCTASMASADLFVAVNAPNTNIVILDVDSDAPAPDNDNVVGASPNFVDLDLQVFGVDQNDLEFTPQFTPGTTEYLATTTMLNSTGIRWISFMLVIGEGSFDGTTDTFVPQSENDATFTNYDFPDVDSPFDSPTFASVDVDGHVLVFSDGLVRPGEQVTVRFTVDVPTNQPVVTFRGSVETVPEPSTFWLLGTAGLVIARFRWKKKIAFRRRDG